MIALTVLGFVTVASSDKAQSVRATPDSLILNASFEDGLADWNTYYGRTARITRGQHSGAGALKTYPKGSAVYQDVSTRVIAGHIYQLSAYARSSTPSGVSAGVGVLVWDANGNQLLSEGAGLPPGTASWTRISVTFTLPSATARVYVQAGNWDASASAEFDDVQLIESTPSPTACSGETRKLADDWATFGFKRGPYVAANSPWNKGELVNGTDYTESITLCTSTFPNGTVFEWSWPNIPASGNVYSYPYIAYGDYGNGPNSTAPANNIKPKQINSIATLTLSHDVTFSGSTNQYDTIYDIFLEPAPTPKYQGYLHEVEVPIHVPSYGCSFVQSKSRGTFVDSQGLEWIIAYNEDANPAVLWFMPADCRDLGKYTVDLLALFKAAVNLGLLTGNEWFTGLSLGVEPQMGSGSITINTTSTNYN